MKSMNKISTLASLLVMFVSFAAQGLACTNDVVPGRGAARAQVGRVTASAAGTPTSANFRFTLLPDGSFQGRNILDIKPSQRCTTRLYSKLDLTSTTSNVRLIARKRTRSRILTLKAFGLPPVSEFRGEVPILNLQTRTVCPGLEAIDSNVYARYLKCGANGKQSVRAKRYPAVLAESIR